MKAINIFIKIYKDLRFQLENSSNDNAKAEGLARILHDGHVIVYILSLKVSIEHVIVYIASLYSLLINHETYWLLNDYLN